MFLPTFVNLQHALAEGTTSLFRILGDHLVRLGRKRDVPQEVLSQFELVSLGAEDAYTAAALGRDIDLLLDFWREHFQPRNTIVVFQIDEVQLCEQLGYRKLSGLRLLLRDSIRGAQRHPTAQT